MMICPRQIEFSRTLIKILQFAHAGFVRLAGVCVVAGALGFGSNVGQALEFPSQIIKVTTDRGAFFFKTEIATSVAQRQHGLMYRKSLASDAAMLFIWPRPAAVSMWMKDTFVSLDMVFIDQGGRVTNIGRATTPLSLVPVSSKGRVIAVLEVVAGTADRIGLKAGDRVWLP